MEDLIMKTIIALSLLAAQVAYAKPVFVTIGQDANKSMTKNFKSAKSLYSKHGVAVMEIDDSQIESLSHFMHEEFHRCGGFMVHDSEAEAIETVNNQVERESATKGFFADYQINQNSVVEEMLKEVNEFEIRTMISKLESFHNRFYKAPTGVESSNWIMSKWQEISAARSDVKVEAFKHANWPQPSIILTIEGSELPNEIVVIGGHADSISGQFGGASARAPGADDNASGVATFTEVLRVLMSTNFKPKRTIQFMAYAAEEVGLLGSKEIAQKYKREGKTVIGVMQLDMTNFHGSARKNLDIVMMNDFTNAAQNEFLGRLIDTYVKVPWGYSKCGYGCSDHASWHGQGYPASMPFESTMEDINKKIHTPNDLLSNSREAIHAEKFARMAVAFAVEMAN
jgi:bacterial leucyl aminopeptidase